MSYMFVTCLYNVVEMALHLCTMCYIQQTDGCTCNKYLGAAARSILLNEPYETNGAQPNLTYRTYGPLNTPISDLTTGGGQDIEFLFYSWKNLTSVTQQVQLM